MCLMCRLLKAKKTAHQNGLSRLSKKVCSPLGPLCEGAPPAGGGGENCTAARNISGYGKVLSLRPYGAPPSQREVFDTLGRAMPAPTNRFFAGPCSKKAAQLSLYGLTAHLFFLLRRLFAAADAPAVGMI